MTLEVACASNMEGSNGHPGRHGRQGEKERKRERETDIRIRQRKDAERELEFRCGGSHL